MKPLLAIVLALAPHVALAETIALTPEQVVAAKEAGAARNAPAAVLGVEPIRDRSIHGEVGVSIGTGGYGALFGTAVAPLGSDGFVAVSFAREQFGDRRYRRAR